MDWLILSELMLGGLSLLIITLILFIWLRRHLIAAGGHLLLSALRTPTSPMWRLGLLRFGPDSLDWFTIAGPSLRPARSWQRSSVRVGIPEPIQDAIPGLPQAVHVDAEVDGSQFELAMDRSAHTAMRSWMESSPPGFNVNVT